MKYGEMLMLGKIPCRTDGPKLPKSKFRKAVEGEKVLQAAYCLGTNCALPRQDTGQVLKLSLRRRNYLVPLHPWESPDLSGHSEPPGLLNQDSSTDPSLLPMQSCVQCKRRSKV